MFKKIFSLDNVISTIFVLLILKYLPAFFNIDFMDPIQSTIQDFEITDISFSKLKNYSDVPIDTNIIIVNIGMLDRAGIAKQIKILNRYKPKVIGVDSFFRKLKGDSLDIPLEQALSEVDNLVFVTKLEDFNNDKNYFDSLSTSNPKFNQYAKTGYANFYVNEQEGFRTIRFFSPKEKVKNQTYYSFALRVTQIYAPEAAKRLLARNNTNEIINFRRNFNKYRAIDDQDVFLKSDSLGFIKDKIVLLGYMGPDLVSPTNEDIFYTPMNSRYVGKNYPDMYGVVVHANIISMILDGKFYSALPDTYSLIFVIVLTFLNMVGLTFMREKHEDMYESVAIVGTFFQMAFFFFLILFLFHFFKFQVKAPALFFAVLISKQAYETYCDSLKVLFIGLFKKLFRKERQKAEHRRHKTEDARQEIEDRIQNTEDGSQ
jgi:CHASE2 domain-containing sensor protein